MPDNAPLAWLYRVVPGVLIALLLALSYLVLEQFLVPLAWAAIIAYVTWPAYALLCARLGGCDWKSALLMVGVLSVLIVLPLLWLSALLRDELSGAYRAITLYLASGPHALPEWFLRIPWLGDRMQEWLDQFAGKPELLRAQLGVWIEESLGELARLVGGAGRNIFKLGMATLALFFFYRDGQALLLQLRRVLEPFVGARLSNYLDAIGTTTKAVVYGLVATALAQGTLAGLGYWAAGVEAPASFGALTALVALIPFGAPIIWGAIGISLLATGKTVAGAGLLLWGALAVSWIDNLLRPLVISSATRIPFLLVLFGVIGGVTAFGLIGLFLGPVILAVLLAVWREWLATPIEDATTKNE